MGASFQAQTTVPTSAVLLLDEWWREVVAWGSAGGSQLHVPLELCRIKPGARS